MTNKMRFFVVLSLLIMLQSVSGIARQTWHLQDDGNWKVLADEEEGNYLTHIARIKRLVSTGQSDAAEKSIKHFKEEFTDRVGPDFEAFAKAEILYSRGKFARAGKSYRGFLTEHPESQFYEAALERLFAIGNAYLGGRKKRVLKIFKIKGFAEGAKIMEHVSDAAGDSPIAVEAELSVARSLEERGKYEEAYLKWSQIHLRRPTGDTGRDSLLAEARCKHAAYKGPKYDASNLKTAMTHYENFRVRYPQYSKRLDIDSKISQTIEQEAYKNFAIGRYYERTDSGQAAGFYYQMVIDRWPDSKASEMASKRIQAMGLVSEEAAK